MATGIIYLDVDDEITSAAARIRSVEETKVGLVVPYGSRVATSRINFRLLAREALERNRRLSIIAADGATRALAASAGLPVFATVQEYEGALSGSTATATPAGSAAAGAAAAGLAGAAATGAAGTTATSTSATPTVVPPTAQPAVDRPSPVKADPEPAPAPRAAPAKGSTTAGRAGRGVSVPLVFAVGAVLLALVVAGVGAYVLLPSATIRVVPRSETIGPVPLTIRADPDATQADPANGVVPASRIELPVEASGTFQATGKRVEEAAATGEVQFDSVNTVGPVSVPQGTRVSTLDDIVFVTTRSVTVPRAQVAGNTIRHGFATAPIRAQRPGPEGNVEANTITQVPNTLSVQQVSASNPQPTSGGKRDEFPVVTQDDVDKAVAALNGQLQEQLTTDVTAGTKTPPNATLFPETARLGDATPTADPASFVGDEVASFDLGMTATGSVIAVDESPIEQIAEQRLRDNVGAGNAMVQGSIAVDVGPATVAGEDVSFPVTAQAARVKLVDAAELRALVRGKPVAEARAALAPYGEVTIDTWPDWVSTIPTLDGRLTLEVTPDVEVEEPGSTSSPSSSSPRAVRPSAPAGSGDAPQASAAP
jgi:hypothetical protein